VRGVFSACVSIASFRCVSEVPDEEDEEAEEEGEEEESGGDREASCSGSDAESGSAARLALAVPAGKEVFKKIVHIRCAICKDSSEDC
jgi:hypothetical protein